VLSPAKTTEIVTKRARMVVDFMVGVGEVLERGEG
jgi:hypothetical protein